MKIFAALLLSVALAPVRASDVEALLPVIEPTGPLVPGTSGRMTFAVRNNGPDAVASISGRTNFWRYGELELTYDGATPECLATIDMPGDNVFSDSGFRFYSEAGLAPGEVLTCQIGFIVPWRRNDGPLQIALTVTTGADSRPDPNPANNRSEISVNVMRGQAVPAWSTWASMLLAFCVVVLGIARRRERRRVR